MNRLAELLRGFVDACDFISIENFSEKDYKDAVDILLNDGYHKYVVEIAPEGTVNFKKIDTLLAKADIYSSDILKHYKDDTSYSGYKVAVFETNKNHSGRYKWDSKDKITLMQLSKILKSAAELCILLDVSSKAPLCQKYGEDIFNDAVEICKEDGYRVYFIKVKGCSCRVLTPSDVTLGDVFNYFNGEGNRTVSEE